KSLIETKSSCSYQSINEISKDRIYSTIMAHALPTSEDIRVKSPQLLTPKCYDGGSLKTELASNLGNHKTLLTVEYGVLKISCKLPSAIIGHPIAGSSCLSDGLDPGALSRLQEKLVKSNNQFH